MSALSSSLQDKPTLRRACMLARHEMSDAVRADAAQDFTGHFLHWIEKPQVLAQFSKEKVISFYVPMRAEMDVLPLARALDAKGHVLALPVVTGRDMPLLFRHWRPGDVLEPGPFRTFAPAASVVEVVPDILIMPLLAFDKYGHRLGYGAGHYDRTLAGLHDKGLRPLCVGAAYEIQAFDLLPSEPHDHMMHAVVTDTAIHLFKQDT